MDCLGKYLEKINEIRILGVAAQNLLENRNNESRVQSNATTKSALVLLTGYLEGYIRELLTELSEKICEINPPLEKLHPLLVASALEDEIASLRKGNSTLDLLNLFSKNRPILLNHKKLAKTGGNPTVDTVEALFGCFGISEALDKLSIQDYNVDTTFIRESQITDKLQQKIKNILEAHAGTNTTVLLAGVVEELDKQWSPKIRRRSVGYVGGIEELLKKRNRIAHGESDEPVTPSDLIDAASMVEGLIKGLHKLAESQVEAISIGGD